MPAYQKLFSNNNRIALRFTLDDTGQIDIAGNRTQWSWKVEIDEVWPPSVAYNTYQPPAPLAPFWYVDINNKRIASGYFTYNFRYTSGATTLGQGTVWLKHATDGTLSVSGTAGARGVPLGSVAVNSVSSDSLQAPRINRGPRVKHSGTYTQTIAYVKYNGTWTLAMPYVKQSGSWVLAGG